MGLLRYISTDDLEFFTVAIPTGTPHVYTTNTFKNTFADTIAGDVVPYIWDMHWDTKRMLEWIKEGVAKLHIKIIRHHLGTSYVESNLDLHYDPFNVAMPDALNPNAGLGTTRTILSATATVNLSTGAISGSWSGVEHWPINEPSPGDPAHDAPFGPQSWGPISSSITHAALAAAVAIDSEEVVRDDLLDYERPNVNFRSMTGDGTRPKSDALYNKSDAHVQAVSGTLYHQSLYLFEGATGCTGIFFRPTIRDFRRLVIAPLNLFGVRIATGDSNLTDPFELTASDTHPSQHWATGSSRSIDITWVDPIGTTYTATLPYGTTGYDLTVDVFEEALV